MNRTQPTRPLDGGTMHEDAGGLPSRRAVRAAGWPLERVLFALAGTVTALSAVLAAVVSPWFLLLTGFVAVNQLAYAAVGACGASFILRRFAGLRSALYLEEKDSR